MLHLRKMGRFNFTSCSLDGCIVVLTEQHDSHELIYALERLTNQLDYYLNLSIFKL